MRFVIDESADARLGGYLRQLGHDVTLIAQNYQPGLADLEVLAIAHTASISVGTNEGGEPKNCSYHVRAVA